MRRLLRGPRAGVRRLVPAARPLRPRRGPRRRLARRARQRRSMARCVALGGEIVELAAGTGWWSPLLASQGELSLYDASPAALERARERLVAHDLRAHLHVRDAWAEPDRAVDGAVHGLLAQPRPARTTRRVPGPRAALAQARAASRLHRLAARPALERGRPSRARERPARCAAWPTAANSRSSRFLRARRAGRRPRGRRASRTSRSRRPAASS